MQSSQRAPPSSEPPARTNHTEMYIVCAPGVTTDTTASGAGVQQYYNSRAQPCTPLFLANLQATAVVPAGTASESGRKRDASSPSLYRSLSPTRARARAAAPYASRATGVTSYTPTPCRETASSQPSAGDAQQPTALLELHFVAPSKQPRRGSVARSEFGLARG